MASHTLMACHECDLLQHLRPLPEGGVACCPRCGAILKRRKRNSIDRTLALTFTGLILFVLANGYPFLAFKLESQVRETTLITGVRELYAQGMWEVALVVLFTSILVPFLQLSALVYILVPLKFSRRPFRAAAVFRTLQHLQPWSMMEVFMVGILVSVVKLEKMATILPGIALFAFLALIFILAGAAAALDPHLVWDRVGYEQ